MWDKYYLDAHLHFSFLQGEIEARDFGIYNFFHHHLRRDYAVQSVSVNENTFPGTSSVRFQYIDSFDGINGVAFIIYCFDSICCVHYHVGEEIFITVDNKKL